MGKSLLITVPLPPAAEPAVGMLVEPGEGQSQAGLLQHRAGGKAPADAALVAPDRKKSLIKDSRGLWFGSQHSPGFLLPVLALSLSSLFSLKSLLLPALQAPLRKCLVLEEVCDAGSCKCFQVRSELPRAFILQG